jgi:adhesin/invasin
LLLFKKLGNFGYKHAKMKKYLISLCIVLFTTYASNAEDVTSEALHVLSEKVSEFTSNLIPGEGHTEASIDFRENHSPDFSILGVREITPIDDGTFFTQFSLFNTEVPNGKPGGDERIIGNLGFGARKLTQDKTILYGINSFYDVDLEENHTRASVGAEVRSAVLAFHFNKYEGLSDEYNEEHVLDGWDYQLSSQIPYLHWASAFINEYRWDGVLRDDVRGQKMGSEMLLTPNLNMEVAYDRKDKTGLDDEWYSKLQFFHPPRANEPTALDGISATKWKENKDMSGELLSKVKRSNKIMIEFKGLSTISRTD